MQSFTCLSKGSIQLPEKRRSGFLVVSWHHRVLLGGQGDVPLGESGQLVPWGVHPLPPSAAAGTALSGLQSYP